MSQRSSRRAGAVVAMSLAVVEPVRAQTELSLLPDAAPPGDAGVYVGAPDTRGSGLFRAKLLLEHAHEPLVLRAESGASERVVERQSSAQAALSYSVGHRVLAYASLPVVRSSGSEFPGGEPEAPTQELALADARIGGRVRVLGPANDGWQVGAAAEVRLPTGRGSAYVGDESIGARAVIALGARRGRYVVSFEAGARLRPSHTLPGVLPTRVGSAVVFGAMLQLPLDAQRLFWLGPELSSALVMTDGARPFDPRSTLAQGLLSGRYRPFSIPLELSAALGPGFGQGAGSAAYRVAFGVAWVPETPPPPPDRDRDSVPDASDVCVGLPGEPSNDPLLHGCPEEPLDSDGDAIPDAFDACPKQPGVVTAERRTHGCPPRPPQPEPPRETPTPAAELIERSIVVSAQVRFETGTATLLAESQPVLEAVGRVLREHSEIELLEVAGHTDDTGTDELNLALSTERARAVLAWLVANGVEEGRLVARGYGRAHPVAANATEGGKALNRRVEFRVLRLVGEQEDTP